MATTINETDFNVFGDRIINDFGTTLYGSECYPLFCGLVEVAAFLLEPGQLDTNPEYTRGQVELIADAVGIGSDCRDIIIEAIQYRHDDIDRQASEPEYTALDRWFDSDETQASIRAMRVAWESEQGQVGDDFEQAVAVVNALTEAVIATVGLPLDVDSTESRQRVYSAILGHSGMADWFEATNLELN